MTLPIVMLLNMLQEKSNVSNIITFKKGISFEENVCNKQIINTILIRGAREQHAP